MEGAKYGELNIGGMAKSWRVPNLRGGKIFQGSQILQGPNLREGNFGQILELEPNIRGANNKGAKFQKKPNSGGDQIPEWVQILEGNDN